MGSSLRMMGVLCRGRGRGERGYVRTDSLIDLVVFDEGLNLWNRLS